MRVDACADSVRQPDSCRSPSLLTFTAQYTCSTVLHGYVLQLQTLVGPLGTPTKPKTSSAARSSPGQAGVPQPKKPGTRSAARTAPEVRRASVDLASVHWIANIPSACHVCACKQTGRLLCVQHGGASWPGRTTNRRAGAHSCHQHPAYYMQHVLMLSVYCTACTSYPFRPWALPTALERPAPRVAMRGQPTAGAWQRAAEVAPPPWCAGWAGAGKHTGQPAACDQQQAYLVHLLWRHLAAWTGKAAYAGAYAEGRATPTASLCPSCNRHALKGDVMHVLLAIWQSPPFQFWSPPASACACACACACFALFCPGSDPVGVT